MELDFLGVHKGAFSDVPNMDRRRGIQNATFCKINPEVVRSVMSSAPGDGFPFGITAVPLSAPSPSRSTAETKKTAPFTIFHDGTVTVFDVTKDQAACLLKMATAMSAKTGVSDKAVASSPVSLSPRGNDLQEGLPQARRKSLERFFQKRKERLMSVFPYDNPKRKDHENSAGGPNSAEAKWDYQPT